MLLNFFQIIGTFFDFTKTCIYLNDDGEGLLFFVNDKAIKEHLQKMSPGDTCYFHTKIENKESGAIFREYAEYAIINSRDFNLVLGKHIDFG